MNNRSDSIDDQFAEWVSRLEDRDPEAVEAIWNEYFGKLMAAVSKKLGGLPRRDTDEEDLALSAMESFFRGAAEGRFPSIHERENLWRLLLTIAGRKVAMLQRKRMTAKRGGGKERGESVFINRANDEQSPGLADVLGREPSQELVAEASEALEHMMSTLDDEIATQIVLYRLEGMTTSDIADSLGCASRTVERKLNKVRQMWSDSIGTDS